MSRDTLFAVAVASCVAMQCLVVVLRARELTRSASQMVRKMQRREHLRWCVLTAVGLWVPWVGLWTSAAILAPETSLMTAVLMGMFGVPVFLACACVWAWLLLRWPQRASGRWIARRWRGL